MKLNIHVIGVVTGLANFAAWAQPCDEQAVDTLVEEALAYRPELKQAQAEERMAATKVPQRQAWPEPMLQLGVQNDSFTRWNIGTMETSWLSVMVTQTLPFPGKRALQEAVARTELEQQHFATESVRLNVEAEVRRVALALQLAQARLELWHEAHRLASSAVEVAWARVAGGVSMQGEAVRAQLEVARVRARRSALEAEVARRKSELQRLTGNAQATSSLSSLSACEFPAAPAFEEKTERNPVLNRVSLLKTQSEYEVAAARRSIFPDVTVGLGVMPRGRLEPMWAATVSVPVPVFANSRQGPAIDEALEQAQARAAQAEALTQAWQREVEQRQLQWKSLEASWQALHGDVLVQGQLAIDSALAQYRGGQSSLSAVLETVSGVLEDRETALLLLAEAKRLIIDDRTFSFSTPAAASPSKPSESGGM